MGDAPRHDRASAFTAVYEQNYVAVRHYVAWHCAPGEVDDVVSDAFLVAWRRFDELDPDWTRPWLFGVVKKVLSERRRSSQRAARFIDQLVATRPAATTDLDAGRLSVEDLELLKAGLQQMPVTDQEVLVLSAWYDMSADDLAVALSITKNNATVRLHRARTRFRTVIAEMERDES